MGEGIGIIGIVGAGDVVEKDEGVVTGDIFIGGRERDVEAIDVLLIGFPGDAGVFEQSDQMIGAALMVGGGVVVVEDAEIGSGLEPEVIGFAGMQARRIIILGAVRGARQQ